MAEDATLGSALVIPESALAKIKEVDNRIKALQDTAKTTAASVTQSFNGMATGTQSFIQALDMIVSKLGTINASAANAGGSLSNIGSSMGSVSSGASNAAQNVVDLVNRLSSIKGAGTSGIMQAAAAFERLQESMKGKSGMNIAELKASIGEIEKQLEHTTTLLTKTEQEALVKRRAVLRDELADQQRTYNERVIAFQQALDRMSRAEQTYNSKQKKAYAAQGKDYQTQNSQKNTTYQGALDFSSTANTLARQAKAIEYLKEARMKLSTADANYKQKLEALNEAIKRHSTVLKEAGVNSAALAEKTSYMSGYISRWAQRMAFAFSVGSITSFAEQVADVRGQFELSQRSLEAILQNKPKADELFNKTVELAVKSPFRIKDLVDYTRQLSAYRIESDKLYDTTKRLADVSAGLGVDMGRLILAYGQVKAAAYLRGSEVRQFTEAGINMYGELQSYFKEVKGEAYSTAQIVDLISKRMVSFEDVEAIFQRMTDKGGTFYNMQEIQAETLQGKISNLKDSFDVMLNDIGKSNESIMKGIIGWTTSMLDNWQAIATAGKALLAVIVAVKLHSALIKTNIVKAFLIDAAMVGKWQAFLNVFRTMPTAISKAKTAIVAMGGAIKAALGGLAVFAAFQVAWDIGQSIYDCNKKIKKTQEEALKARGAIGALAGAYDNLAKAASNAGDKMTSEDLEKNIADRRMQLQKLIDSAAKDGLTFKIDVEALDEKQLNNVFNSTKKEYTNFIDSIELIRTRYAKNQRWNTWVTDGLDDNAAQYKDAVVEALGQSAALERVIANINAGYKNATKETEAYYAEIRAGQKDGESNLDYMTRMYNLIRQINKEQGGSFYRLPNFFSGSQKDFDSFNNALSKVQTKAMDLKGDFNAVFGNLKKEYNNDPVKIQATIDMIAAEKDWNQYERDLAYRHFGINIYIKKAEMEKEVSWVDDYISNFFAKKKYGVNLVLKNISDADALDDFIEKGDEAAKAARNYQEIEKRLAAVGKNQKELKVDDDIRKLFKAGDPRVGGETIDVKTLRAMIKEYKEASAEKAKSLGVDPFEKDNKGNKTDKTQRDILQERINLLKDMNSKYNELLKTESAEQALSKTRTYFKEAAQNVGWKADEILPDDASVAKRVRELAATAKDVAKRGNYLRIAADIEWNISKEEYDKMKTEVSRNIEDAFSGLDLYKKLKDNGLSDTYIKSQFGDLASSFEEVQKKIDEAYNQYITRDYEEKFGKDRSKWSGDTQSQYNSDIKNTTVVLETRFKGSDILKEYQDQKRKLGEQAYKDQVNQANELISAYKTQLTDQLELDWWYYKEKSKIQQNPRLTPELKQKLQGNLQIQYENKTDENTWKNFAGKDSYVELFKNLDYASTATIDNMLAQLENLKSSMNNLSPENLKAIVEQMNKLKEEKANRYPFLAIAESINEISVAQKNYATAKAAYDQQFEAAQERTNASYKEYIELLEQAQLIQNDPNATNSEKDTANSNAENALDKYKENLKTSNALQENFEKATNRLSTAWGNFANRLNTAGAAISSIGDKTASLSQAITGKATTSLTKWTKAISGAISGMAEMAKAFKDLQGPVGNTKKGLNDANKDVSDNAKQMTQGVVSGITTVVTSSAAGTTAAAATASTAIKTVEKASVILAIISAALTVATAIANLFNDESDIDEEIEAQQRKLARLQHSYSKLQKQIEDAWSVTSVTANTDVALQNTEKQIESINAMIEAEKGRKDPDQGQIEEWEREIDDLKEQAKELKESLTESLGGLGSEANYKAAAQEFADAWVDAFNEGGDTLDALNEKLNDLVTNLLKKQLMMRGAQKILEPLFKAIDKAVDKESEGGYDVTKGELAELKDMGEMTNEQLNEYFSSMAEVLGMLPTASSNLSDLQQGIQSVTESTASALESILNSMRYYLSLQQADVMAIRYILQAQSSSNAMLEYTSPMMAELREHTGYLKQIVDYWDSVVKAGHSKGRSGIRVFLD